MAIGASFAGVRAMTATSGGGFCLMTERLGLAAISETPVVIMDAQRPGPVPDSFDQAIALARQGEDRIPIGIFYLNHTQKGEDHASE